MKSSEARTDDLDREKGLYLSQIRFLDEQLERFQLQCDKVKEESKDIVLKTSALQKDTRDILEYLHHLVAALEKDEQELRERVEQQLQADRDKSGGLQLLVNQEEQELQEELDRLGSEDKMQAARLEDQKVQLVHLKQQMVINPSAKEEQRLLEHQHLSVVNTFYIEQRKLVDEKKKSVMSSIQLKMSSMFEKEMKERREKLMEVKCAMQESYQLHWSRCVEKDRLKSLCRTAIKMRILNFKLIRKIFSLRKESEKLTKKCKLLMGQINELQRSNESLLDYSEACRQYLASGSQECHQKASLVALLEERLQRERSGTRRLEGDLKRAASVLTAVAMNSDKMPGGELRMQKVLQALGTSELQRAESSEADVASADAENVSRDPLFLMAKLRPGDLCLVPGPTWRPRAAAPSLSSQTPQNRVKLPPIQQSLWKTALHEWMR
ncbi:cilia- and flagella-associated protein 157-like [Fundulus heteroclitus]|uniref:cilia- and flagella-associated protein 157-like n=1 Tax=Fundulus heteroclitus TaxID=8078 RepID=UPI00165C24E4|nr:cilia- and flagella-associated protein 157-like [Fundulus heteroclitus]